MEGLLFKVNTKRNTTVDKSPIPTGCQDVPSQCGFVRFSVHVTKGPACTFAHMITSSENGRP